MESYLRILKERYEAAALSADPRTNKWPLVESPLPMLVLVAGYLLFVKYGRQYMEDKKPMSLKYFMMFYNLALVLLSFYIASELFISSLRLKFNYYCDLIDYSENPDSVRLASALWWYYISKVIEFMDTVIFILRKKNNQVSFLHVYHHSTMVFLWWIGVKWYAGGASFFSAMINCSVHVIMYSYYFLSGFGDLFKKYLWWKKYLTMIQLGQFFLLVIHVTQAVLLGCEFDNRPMITLFFYLLSHIALFSNFYAHAYNNKPKKSVGATATIITEEKQD